MEVKSPKYIKTINISLCFINIIFLIINIVLDFTETFLSISVIFDIIINLILLICLIMIIIFYKYYIFRIIIATVIPSSFAITIITTILSIRSLLNDTKLRAIFYFVSIFKDALCFISTYPLFTEYDDDD